MLPPRKLKFPKKSNFQDVFEYLEYNELSIRVVTKMYDLRESTIRGHQKDRTPCKNSHESHQPLSKLQEKYLVQCILDQ